MSAESKSEATWRGFFLAAINAGVGTVVGMISGFVVGGVADIVISAATGHEQVRYSYVLAEAGTYLGLFVGIVLAIGAGGVTAAGKAVESSEERIWSPSDGAEVNVARGVDQVTPSAEHDDTEGFGGAAAA